MKFIFILLVKMKERE